MNIFIGIKTYLTNLIKKDKTIKKITMRDGINTSIPYKGNQDGVSIPLINN